MIQKNQYYKSSVCLQLLLVNVKVGDKHSQTFN